MSKFKKGDIATVIEVDEDDLEPLNKFLTLKIPVENNLDEIVSALERLGYVVELKTPKKPKSICTYEDGTYHVYMREAKHKTGNLTTLAELRSMSIETLKEM